MCGILGQISKKELDSSLLCNQLKLINHRGPDNSDFYFSANKKVFFGHTRLSILDLSNNGNQPMKTICGRYIISFNGEIYNFKELKNNISHFEKEHFFVGSSDTEILLTHIKFFGLKETLKIARGMFAFALYDNNEDKLYLARDRAGEKPLYYGFIDDTIFFSSELKCFSFFKELKLSKNALNLYMAQGNVPAPYSIYENIFKLIPGTCLEYTDNSNYNTFSYWELDSEQSNDISNLEESYSQFEQLFLDALSEQMIADVPLGAFLSGGIDSSCVVAGMKEISNSTVKTHTIAFKESQYDESDAAKNISNYLGTEHHEFTFDSKDALDLVPRLATIYCEPFADSSQIPTYFLSKLTRSNVKVSLSGDGGDELFGGYNRYIFFNRFQNTISKFSFPTRKFLSDFCLRAMENSFMKNIMSSFFEKIFHSKSSIEKLEKICHLLRKETFQDIYFALLQQWDYEDWPLSYSYSSNPRMIYDQFLTKDVLSFREMREMDFKNYLSNDILVKLDRASMSVSLESRVPFLDQRIIDFAFKLPTAHLIQKSRGKVLLRKFLSGRVPSNILELPKSGFGVPIENWLRSGLREWSQQLLFHEKDELRLFDNETIKTAWNEHISNKRLRHHQIWSVLMLKLWLRDNNNVYLPENV